MNRTDPVAIIQALGRADLLVSGGGGLFQDVTGPASTLYYGGLILLARALGKRVCIWSQGVGPLNQELGRAMARLAFGAAQTLCVRDAASARLVQELCGKQPTVCADPVWLLDYPFPQKPADAPWTLGVSLRCWPSLGQGDIEHLGKTLAEWLLPLSRPVRVSLFAFQQEQDEAVLSALASALTRHGLPGASHWVSPDKALASLGQCDALIGMRFHSLILATLAGVPAFGLSYDPKVDALLSALGLPGIAVESIGQLTVERLQRGFVAAPHPPALQSYRQQARIGTEILRTALLS